MSWGVGDLEGWVRRVKRSWKWRYFVVAYPRKGQEVGHVAILAQNFGSSCVRSDGLLW